MILLPPPPPPPPPTTTTPTPPPQQPPHPHLSAPPSHSSALQFNSKTQYLRSLNLNPTTLLNKHPSLRTSPLQSLIAVERTLTSPSLFNLPRPSLARVLDMHPRLLTSSPSLHLLPIFTFLRHTLPLPHHKISPTVLRCPRLLVSDVESQLLPTLHFLRHKLLHSRFEFSPQTALLLVSSVDNTLVPKLEYLERELGFSEAEVVRMVRRCPALLTYSVENNFRKKVDYFVGAMKGDLEEIRRFPQFFAFSLEKRIVPRHEMMVEVGVEMSLRDMLTVSDGEFRVRLLELRLRRSGFH